MSEDQFIARLMSETFSNEDRGQHNSRPISKSSHEVFNQRRTYAKMGVRPIEGQWLSESLLRFDLDGLVIELPIGHRPFEALKTRNATLVEKEKSAAFINVISHVLHTKFDRMLMTTTLTGSPILLLWNSREAKVNTAELVGLVRGKSKLLNVA